MLCRSCPRACDIRVGRLATGTCLARTFQGIQRGGHKTVETKPLVSTMLTGPMEQKLYHYMPGSTVFSVGFTGCNLACRFCQNWEISQQNHAGWAFDPSGLRERLLKTRAAAFAFTYTEPALYPSFVSDTFKLVHNAGKKTILKTNACVATEEFDRILRETDAVNIDVKGAIKVRKSYPKNCILIFIMPPSMHALKRRLRSRMS